MVRKDLSAIWNRRGIRALLMALPMVLVVVIPLVYSVAISLLPVPENASLPATLRSFLPAESAQRGYRAFWMDAFTTLLCPMLFLSVPIVCGVASASCAFVSERENGTLETLFLSSMNAKSIFHSKITVCTLLSVVVSLIFFVIFTITISVADLMMTAPYFFNFDWLVTVLLLMPAVALFSVTFVSLILPRVRSVGESLQTIGYLMLPFILLYLLQFSGALRVTVLLLVVLAVLLCVLSVVMFNFSARGFQAEKLLIRPVEEQK